MDARLSVIPKPFLPITSTVIPFSFDQLAYRDFIDATNGCSAQIVKLFVVAACVELERNMLVRKKGATIRTIFDLLFRIVYPFLSLIIVDTCRFFDSIEPVQIACQAISRL